MKTKKVLLIIEASSTGFSVYADGFPAHGYGKTVEDAKSNFQSAVGELLEYYKEEGTVPDPVLNNGDLQFEYRYDLPSIFNHFGMLDISSLAKKIGMNASLLRQYKTGHALASDKQKQKIEKGLHALGKELMNVRL